MQRVWSAEELGERRSLLIEDLVLLTGRVDAGKLGFAVQLAFWRQHGRFPDVEADVAPAVVAHLAAQIGVSSDALDGYAWAGRSGRRYRVAISNRPSRTHWYEPNSRKIQCYLNRTLQYYPHRDRRGLPESGFAPMLIGRRRRSAHRRERPMDQHLSNRRAILATAAAALATPAIRRAHAAPGITDELVKAAQAEGTLNYYHNSDIDTTGPWSLAFVKRFGIEIRPMRLPSYPLFDRWLNEERVGRHLADLIQITDPTLLDLADRQGFVEHYQTEAGAGIDPELKRDGVWYALFVDYMGIGYNHQKVSAEEEVLIRSGGWDVLRDARWAGRMGTATPASGGSSYAYGFMMLNTLRDHYGPGYFQALAAGKPDIYASKAPLFERLSAGEYALMDQGTQSSLSDFYQKGAPVRWFFPEPTLVSPTVQSVSRHAPHPNAARLFQEWCCTAESQAGWLALIAAGSPRSDVTGPRRAAAQDWYRESWYAPPKSLYTEYLKDAAFADPKKPVIAEWNSIFNYGGGRKG